MIGLAGPFGEGARAASLQITVTGLRNDHGTVRVAVCSRERFLQPTCEYGAATPARVGEVTVGIDAIVPGDWAVQAFHDENANGILDRTWLGMPAEGMGFSRDPRFNFGPPRFDDAALRIGQTPGRIRVGLRYY